MHWHRAIMPFATYTISCRCLRCIIDLVAKTETDVPAMKWNPTYILFTGIVRSLSIRNTKFLSIILNPNFSVFTVMHLKIVVSVSSILGLILLFVLHSHFITIHFYWFMQFRFAKLLHSNLIPSYFDDFWT